MKTYNYRLIYLCIFLFCIGFSPCNFANNAASRLGEILQNLHTMQADFMQTGSITGKMFLQRPGKFRWQVLKPDPQLILVNGQNIWIYDPDLQQAIKKKVSPKETGNPAVFLSGSIKQLQQDFLVTEKPSATKDEAKFTLKPKSDAAFTEVTLRFSKGVLQQMTVIDNLGDHSDFHFMNIKINQKLTDNLFIFAPPAGVDVVEE